MGIVRILALSVLCLAANAGAVVLCARQRADGTFNSTVRIRESCRATEMQLDPVALGLEGPPGPQGAKGDPGVPGSDAGVTVRDSTGKIIGAWKPEPANAGQAVLTLSGRAVALPVLPYGFYDQQTVKVYYESSDCTGSPLLRDDVIADGGAPHPDFLFVYQGFDVSGTAYYPRSLRFSSLLASYELAGCSVCAPFGCSCAPLTTPAGCSTAGGAFVPPDRCCFSYAGPSTEVVAEIDTYDLSSLGLIPPLHLEGP
jgi:hypothetical protein